MKKFLIYVLIVGLVGCVFSITMHNVRNSIVDSSVSSVISTVGVGAAYADSLGYPDPPPPPSPIPK